jgi:hypothetical protein
MDGLDLWGDAACMVYYSSGVVALNVDWLIACHREKKWCPLLPTTCGDIIPALPTTCRLLRYIYLAPRSTNSCSIEQQIPGLVKYTRITSIRIGLYVWCVFKVKITFKVCLVPHFTQKNLSFGLSFCKMELNTMQNFWQKGIYSLFWILTSRDQKKPKSSHPPYEKFSILDVPKHTLSAQTTCSMWK